MALYRPTKDTKIWWYDFIFQGQRIRESAKTRSKTVAREAERLRRREIEESYHGIKRRERVKLFSVAADEWLAIKALTLAPSSQSIEKHNLNHLRPHFGKCLISDIQAKDVARYQKDRLAEGAAPKTINLEVGTLRSILRRNRVWAEIQHDVKLLATSDDVGCALTPDEEAALLAACCKSRSRCLYPAVSIALNTGMRYSEIRLLQWKQIDFIDRFVTVGKTKTSAGTGRVIPLNSTILEVLVVWAAQFPHRRPNEYVFPFERYGAKGVPESFGFTVDSVTYDTDPSRPIGNWKEAWEKAKERAGEILRQQDGTNTSELHQQRTDLISAAQGRKQPKKNVQSTALKCRFHDLRHSAVTRLLEAGVPYPVVASIVGWSASTAIRMSKRYGHIGQTALRNAMETLGNRQNRTESLKFSPKGEPVQNQLVQ